MKKKIWLTVRIKPLINLALSVQYTPYNNFVRSLQFNAPDFLMAASD